LWDAWWWPPPSSKATPVLPSSRSIRHTDQKACKQFYTISQLLPVTRRRVDQFHLSTVARSLRQFHCSKKPKLHHKTQPLLGPNTEVILTAKTTGRATGKKCSWCQERRQWCRYWWCYRSLDYGSRDSSTQGRLPQPEK
jgi:hypothetical protein